jgi:hypothetical protein
MRGTKYQPGDNYKLALNARTSLIRYGVIPNFVLIAGTTLPIFSTLSDGIRVEMRT